MQSFFYLIVVFLLDLVFLVFLGLYTKVLKLVTLVVMNHLASKA